MMSSFAIKRAYTCEHECKKIHKYISVGIDRKSRLPVSTCARKFGNSELVSISRKLFLHSNTQGRRSSRRKLARVVCYNFKRGGAPDVCSAQDSEACAWRRVIKGSVLDKGEEPKQVGNAPIVHTHVRSGRIGEEGTRSATSPNVPNRKNILSVSSNWSSTGICTSGKMKKIKFRSFTQIVAVSKKKDKCVKFSRLSLSELLQYILVYLSEEGDVKTWNGIFLQVDKLVSKKGGGEEYKAELNAFFDKLTNMEYYGVLDHLKDVEEGVKNGILNGAFFECLVLSLRGRDITYLHERGGERRRGGEAELAELADSPQMRSGSPAETTHGDPAQAAKKREGKVKSYVKNLKHLLNISGSRRGSTSLEEQQWQSGGEEKRLDHFSEKGEASRAKNLAIFRDTQNDVTMIRKWFTLLSHFPSKSEHVPMLRDYLNRMFRKHIDELIRKEYFSKTVHQMTNQINSKSIHALIMTYERKLGQMEAYDFSYSLIILLRFMLFSHSLFNRIVEHAIGNPLAKLKSERHLVRFMKSVDGYPLVHPSGAGVSSAEISGVGGSGGEISGQELSDSNFNGTEIFQCNMNDLYNSTFSIFIKKLSKKLKCYSLDNLLFLSECLGKVIFMPSTQNQVLHVFINKLRYYIDNALHFSTVDNQTLIRLFKISSFFSFVPEVDIFVSSAVKGSGRVRRFVGGGVAVPSKGPPVGGAENVPEGGAVPPSGEAESVPVKDSPPPTGNKKILKGRNDDTLDEKSKKKSICFNLSEKGVINYYYDKAEETHTVAHPRNVLRSYDLLQVRDNVYDVNKYLLNYSFNQDSGKKHKRSKFSLKNMVTLLCEQIDRSLDDVVRELRGGVPAGREAVSQAVSKAANEVGSKAVNEMVSQTDYPPWSRDQLVDEIKRINEKNAERGGKCPGGDHPHRESELYKRYLIFYDFSVLSDVMKFTHFSINTNKHTYELVKTIKRRLEEMLLFYGLSGVPPKRGADLTTSGLCGHKMKHIATFQLYHFYCACKNFSPSFLFEFFDTLLKLTPKINVIDLDKASDLFSKKRMNRMEHLEIFHKVRDRHVTIPFVVSLLQSLRVIISSNLFLTNDVLREHVSTMVQYSYYVLFFYYYSKERSGRLLKGGGKERVDDGQSPICEGGQVEGGQLGSGYVESTQRDGGSDRSAISSVMKSTERRRKLCLFDNVHLEDLCNTYLCLSTSLYFLNRAEEKSNQVKHLIFLEERFLKLVTKGKYMKYLSDSFIFFLFKAPCTLKLEEAFDGVIPSLKMPNRRGRKTSELLSSITHSQREKILSVPAATAFFLCKVKLTMSGGGGKGEVNALRVENTRRLFEALIDGYKLLASCVEQVFITGGGEAVNRGGNSTDGEEYPSDNSHISNQGTSFRGGAHFSVEDTPGGSSLYGSSPDGSSLHGSSPYGRTYSHLPYLLSSKLDVKQNGHLEALMGDMFFGVHEVKSLHELQSTLLKTVKHLEVAQINLKVNYKITQIQQIHNDVLGYLAELSNVVRDCLYIVFLSQPYVHKSPKKYATKNLLNYFINKCKFVSDYNLFDDCSGGSFGELRRSKYMANELCR
ncbi:conserved Plasmodium protein, unknown function [Plasmodium vivax]|uniref:Uncharacterized protein n=1 Tax=Plasmodium vivax TaxID=5855 RepID=A0A1G4HFZ4_PLAVI|nr:conserved Plasmodium protein, unknown function [Plasmodium vivax]